jgi:hypothetical protein
MVNGVVITGVFGESKITLAHTSLALAKKEHSQILTTLQTKL